MMIRSPFKTHTGTDNLVAPAKVSPEEWIAAAAKRALTVKEPGTEGEDQ